MSLIEEQILYQTEGFNVSERYNAIPSVDVIHRFERFGFDLDSIEAGGVRSLEKQLKQKHMIRMSAPVDKISGMKQQVVIYNSTDGTAALKIHVGYFRMVCANSMVAGNHVAPVFSIKHSSTKWEDELDTFIDSYDINLAKQAEFLTELEATSMGLDEAYMYAEKALGLRHYDKRIGDDWVDPLEVLIAQRKEDRGNTAFHMMQRMQENIVHGFFRKYDSAGEIRKAKIMTNIDELLRFNSELSGMFEDKIYGVTV